MCNTDIPGNISFVEIHAIYLFYLLNSSILKRHLIIESRNKWNHRYTESKKIKTDLQNKTQTGLHTDKQNHRRPDTKTDIQNKKTDKQK